jgi:anaerobic selenocysteine-containing dehydrogenase
MKARLMYGRAGSGSSLGTAAHAQTVIAFGWNPVISQGAWHDADMDGDRVDYAGSINVLTGHRASPLAFGNSQHTNLCQIERAARKG